MKHETMIISYGMRHDTGNAKQTMAKIKLQKLQITTKKWTEKSETN